MLDKALQFDLEPQVLSTWENCSS